MNNENNIMSEDYIPKISGEIQQHISMIYSEINKLHNRINEKNKEVEVEFNEVGKAWDMVMYKVKTTSESLKEHRHFSNTVIAELIKRIDKLEDDRDDFFYRKTDEGGFVRRTFDDAVENLNLDKNKFTQAIIIKYITELSYCKSLEDVADLLRYAGRDADAWEPKSKIPSYLQGGPELIETDEERLRRLYDKDWKDIKEQAEYLDIDHKL